MITRRKFIKNTTIAAGGTAVLFSPFVYGKGSHSLEKSKVVSVSSDNILTGEKYNPDVVHRVYEAGLKELTGEKTLKNAWSSLFSSEDVVGIKINCLGAPKISSSIASINEVIAGLKSAGVKENNIIVWDHADGAFRRTGLKINRSSRGVRIHGTSRKSGTLVPWVEGYDKNVYLELEFGTLKRYRELMKKNFTRNGTHREIFNSITWLWMLIALGNKKAQKYKKEVRRLYMDYNDRKGVKKLAEEVADKFNDITIKDENRSYFSKIVTRDINKLINIAVLKHNEDSGVTFCLKNVALGVTTNKVRFHIDYCAIAISEIMSFPCIKDKLVLNIGEAAKISTVSVLGAQLAFDKRIFFSYDPVAVDRIGLDLLEKKRMEQNLPSIRDISTHIKTCAKKGIGTDNPELIDLVELKL